MDIVTPSEIEFFPANGSDWRALDDLPFIAEVKVMGESRPDMLAKVVGSWEALQEALGRVPTQRMTEAGVVEAWSVKDLIGHVTSWEKLAIAKIRTYQEEVAPSTLEWSGVDEFNAETTESNRKRSLDDLRSDMRKIHDELMAFLEGLPTDVAEKAQVQRCVRVDGYGHYAEHTEHIISWLNAG